MALKISLELPNDFRYVGTARASVRLLLERERVQDDDIADVELVIGELATNAVRHAEVVPGLSFQVEFEFWSKSSASL